MTLTRDIVGYRPNPPYVIWPGGVKVEVNLALYYEEGSAFMRRLDIARYWLDRHESFERRA